MIVTGKVTDSSGAGVPAVVYVSTASGQMAMPTIGTQAGTDGSYTLDVPLARYTSGYITAQLVGSTPQTKPADKTLDFILGDGSALDEITVTAQRTKARHPGIILALVLSAVLGLGYGIYRFKQKK